MDNVDIPLIRISVSMCGGVVRSRKRTAGVFDMRVTLSACHRDVHAPDGTRVPMIAFADESDVQPRLVRRTRKALRAACTVTQGNAGGPFNAVAFCAPP